MTCNAQECLGLTAKTFPKYTLEMQVDGESSTGDWEGYLNNATTTKETNTGPTPKITMNLLPVCSGLQQEEMNLISAALRTKLSLHLACLSLAQPTVKVLEVSSSKPNIKEMCKNVKPHHSSHEFIIFTSAYNYLKCVHLNFEYSTY